MLLSVNVAVAQDAPESPWKHGGNVGFNMAQSHFDNWTAGGQDNVNFLSLAKYNINFKQGNHKWDNGIDLMLGYNYFDFKEDPIKTDDRIFLSSLYGYNMLDDKLFVTANMTFQTQFTNGYDYKTDSTNRISGFMVPAYVTLGVGAQWVPNEYFSLNVAPVTGRLTIVNDQKFADAGAFGVNAAEYDETTGELVKHGDKTRWELGAQITATFKYEIFKNVTFSSKLIAFYDYLHKSSDLNALLQKYDMPIDFDWDNALILKVNDWLSCNVTARLVYDEDIAPIKADSKSFFQFKEVLSIGISYNIP